jgi:hypothetical protein
MEEAPLRPVRDVHVRRLLFIKQYEALREWLRLRDERCAGIGFVRLRFESYTRSPAEFHFRVLEGAELLEKETVGSTDDEAPETADAPAPAPADAAPASPAVASPAPAAARKPGFSMMPWLVAAAAAGPDEEQGAPPAYLSFPDACYHDRISFEEYERVPLQFATVTNVALPAEGAAVRVSLRLGRGGPTAALKFTAGQEYLLMRRQVDFNLHRSLEALRALDSATPKPLLLRLLADATEWGAGKAEPSDHAFLAEVDVLQRLHGVLHSLDNPVARNLVMKRSQVMCWFAVEVFFRPSTHKSLVCRRRRSSLFWSVGCSLCGVRRAQARRTSCRWRCCGWWLQLPSAPASASRSGC